MGRSSLPVDDGSRHDDNANRASNGRLRSALTALSRPGPERVTSRGDSSIATRSKTASLHEHWAEASAGVAETSCVIHEGPARVKGRLG